MEFGHKGDHNNPENPNQTIQPINDDATGARPRRAGIIVPANSPMFDTITQFAADAMLNIP